MKRKIKRIVARMLILAMLSSIVSIVTPENVSADVTDFVVDLNGVLKSYQGIGGDIVIPSNVKVIGRKAFSGNDTIWSVTIPSSVERIEESAFDSCSYLKKVDIKPGVTFIGDNAFWGCSALTEVSLPDSLKEIGYGAFCHCGKLNGIIIPSSVTKIGYHAFGHLYVNLTYSEVYDFTIVAEKGSAGEQYAKDNSIAILDKKDLQSKVTKVKSTAKKKATVTYQKANVDGYQIQYSTDSKFSKSKTKTVTVKNRETLSKKISGLKSGAKYYVRVSGYKIIAGKKISGEWSKGIAVAVK